MGMKLPATMIVLVFSIVLLPGDLHGHPGRAHRTPKEQLGGAQWAKTEREMAVAGPNAEPVGPIKERQKRLSDQRRAELETLMALSKMTGKLVNVSRGGRQLDNAKSGRRRRSVIGRNLGNLRTLFQAPGDPRHKGSDSYPVIS
ncbi:hypothetical protein KM043_001448 [Ampulex compressa]|nr:hypothetical protein KM043_001448 [Ampulex compressa]